MYIGARPSGEVVRAFVSGLELAVLTAKGSSPLSDEERRWVQDSPDGDCADVIKEFDPVLVTLLTALKSGR